MNTLCYSAPGFKNQQRGIVLAVCLVLLLVMTLLGVMSVGTATSEQKVANNYLFRNSSFQAAESAIENVINTPSVLGAAIAGPVSTNLATLGGYGVTSNSVTQFVAAGPPVGGPDGSAYSFDSFAAIHFTITGTGVVGGVANSQAVTSQGVFIIAPAVH